MTKDEIEAIAHRKAWKYKHSSDPHHSHTYTFNTMTLHDFADALLKQASQDRQDAEKALNVLLAWMEKRYDNDQGLDWVDQDAAFTYDYLDQTTRAAIHAEREKG